MRGTVWRAVARGRKLKGLGWVARGAWLKRQEMYETWAGLGRALPDMSVPRQGCAAVCIEGNVYDAGGISDDATVLASMECFDPIASEWRTLPSMSNPRCYCAAVACDM